MDHFLCEVFDVPQPSFIKNIETLFDLEDKKLLYTRLYKHPFLLFNLTFNFIWEQCFGVIPGKMDVFTIFSQHMKGLSETLLYSAKSGLTPQMRSGLCQLVLEYLYKHTFLAYVPKNTPNLPQTDALLKAAVAYFEKIENTPQEAEKELKQKLAKRLIPYVGFLLTLSQSCEPEHAHTKLENFIKDHFDNIFDNKENPKDAKSEQRSLTAYAFYTCLLEFVGAFLDANHENPNQKDLHKRFYSLTEKHVKLFGLTTKNVYTDFTLYEHIKKRQALPTSEWLSLTPFECISFQINQDYYFLRMLFQKSALVDFSSHSVNNINTMISETFYDIFEKLLTKKGNDPPLFFTDTGLKQKTMISHQDDKNECSIYGRNAYVFDACVPRLFGTFVTFRTPTFFRVIAGKGLYHNICVENIDHLISLNNRYPLPENYKSFKVVRDAHVLTKYPLWANISPSFTPFVIPYSQEDREIGLTEEFVKLCMDVLWAKTTRELHFARSLCWGKSYILRYKAERQIDYKEITNNTNNTDEQPLASSKNHEKFALLYIDTRANPGGLDALRITLHNLNTKHVCWEVVIATLQENEAYYMKYAKFMGVNLRFLRHPLLKLLPFNIDAYNRVMKSNCLWNDLKEMGYEKCLIIQDDSMLFRPGFEERFLTFDFIGPPWLKCASNAPLLHYVGETFVGNGGLSWRNVQLMYHITKEYQKEKNYLFNDMLQPIQEDVYFGMCVQQEARIEDPERPQPCLPTYNEAREFGMEQVWSSDAFGVHKFWVYNDREKISAFFDKLSVQNYGKNEQKN